MMAGMVIRGLRTALWIAPGLLVLISILTWLSYVGNGMAYGGVLGLPSREKDAVVFGAKAFRALIVALAAEGLAVSLVTWDIARVQMAKWVSLAIATGVSAFLTALTFILVRGM
jgi:hypothetical protein